MTPRPETLEALQRERDELSRRLSEALALVAQAQTGAYSRGGMAEAQHDHLAQELRDLKLQDFQGVCIRLYDFWKTNKRTEERQQVQRAYALVQFRNQLADQILVKGMARLLLAQESGDPKADREQVRRGIQDALLEKFRLNKHQDLLPEGLLDGLRAAIGKGLDFLRAMTMATPPGYLLVPPPGAPFNPDHHEAVVGCPTNSGVKVKLTAFPGYLPLFSSRVLERALVYTVEN